MTLDTMYKAIKNLLDKYQPDTKVYFDCPECKKSFTPDKVVTTALHIPADK